MRVLRDHRDKYFGEDDINIYDRIFHIGYTTINLCIHGGFNYNHHLKIQPWGVSTVANDL